MKSFLLSLLLLIHSVFATISLSFEDDYDRPIITKAQLAVLATKRNRYHLSVEPNFPAEYESYIRHYADVKTIESTISSSPYQSNPDLVKVKSVVFAPKDISSTNKSRVLIHVHGGPQSEFTVRTLQLELLYYLSRGFFIIATNYRGTYLGETPSIENGAHDVYNCAHDIIFNHYSNLLQHDQVYINSISYGANIASYLITRLWPRNALTGQDKHYKNIFKGVALTAGNYSHVMSKVPHIISELTIMVSHGFIDSTFPVGQAVEFARKLLENKHSKLVLFISYEGGHHISDPFVITGEEQMIKLFIDSYSHLLDEKFLPAALIAAIRQYDETNESFNVISQEQKNIQAALSRSLKLNRPLGTLPSLSEEYAKHFLYTRKGIAKSKNWSIDFFEHFYPAAVSKKHEPEKIFSRICSRYFTSALDYSVQKLKDCILDDVVFHQQMNAFIEEERRTQAQNPNSYTLYHGTSGDVMLNLFFNNFVRQLINGETEPKELMKLKHLRLTDNNASKFKDATEFEKYMDRFRVVQKDQEFNNLPGYSSIAMSFNMFLHGGHDHIFTFTPHYYFTSTSGVNGSSFEFFRQALKLMGIYTPNRFVRYSKLINDLNPNQSMILSFTLEDIDKYAYVSEMYGEPIYIDFDDSGPKSSPSKFINIARQSISKLESILIEQQYKFHNPAGFPDFGKIENGFSYVEALQVRVLLHPDLMNSPTTKISYQLRDPSTTVLQELYNLVVEDMSFLAAQKLYIKTEWFRSAAFNPESYLTKQLLSKASIGKLSPNQFEIIVKYNLEDEFKVFFKQHFSSDMFTMQSGNMNPLNVGLLKHFLRHEIVNFKAFPQVMHILPFILIDDAELFDIMFSALSENDLFNGLSQHVSFPDQIYVNHIFKGAPIQAKDSLTLFHFLALFNSINAISVFKTMKPTLFQKCAQLKTETAVVDSTFSKKALFPYQVAALVNAPRAIKLLMPANAVFDDFDFYPAPGKSPVVLSFFLCLSDLKKLTLLSTALDLSYSIGNQDISLLETSYFISIIAKAIEQEKTMYVRSISQQRIVITFWKAVYNYGIRWFINNPQANERYKVFLNEIAINIKKYDPSFIGSA